MERHFVTFMSPGTFVNEETTQEIDSWDVKEAMRRSRDVRERHGAVPFGFYFSTRSRRDDDLDSRVTKTSNTYYLGGTILTLEDIKARNDPDDRILISNMECNDWARVIENNNSWRSVRPLNDDDVVLDMNNFEG